MARKCTVCVHPDREEIDKLLLSPDVSLREISGLYSLSKSSLDRHMDGHISAALAKVAEQSEILSAEGLMKEANDLLAAARRIMHQAETNKDPRLVLQALDRGLKSTELIGKLVAMMSQQQDEREERELRVRFVPSDEHKAIMWDWNKPGHSESDDVEEGEVKELTPTASLQSINQALLQILEHAEATNDPKLALAGLRELRHTLKTIKEQEPDPRYRLNVQGLKELADKIYGDGSPEHAQRREWGYVQEYLEKYGSLEPPPDEPEQPPQAPVLTKADILAPKLPGNSPVQPAADGEEPALTHTGYMGHKQYSDQEIKQFEQQQRLKLWREL